MGRDDPGVAAGRNHAQPVHDGVSADGGDHSVARLVQPDDPADRGGLQFADGAAYRTISGDRGQQCPRPGEAVPFGVGHRLLVVRPASGAVRTFLRQRPVDPGAGSGIYLSEAGTQGPGPGIPEPRRPYLVTRRSFRCISDTSISMCATPLPRATGT